MADVAGTAWPIGWLTWDKERFTIEGIYVNDGYRGKGIGVELMKEAEKVAGRSLKNDSGAYTPAGLAWAKKRGIDAVNTHPVSVSDMAQMQARMNNLLIGSTDLIKRQLQKVGARTAGRSFRGGTIYRGLRASLPPDIDAKVQDLLAMETDEESYRKWGPHGGKKVQAGELIVKALEKSHWDAGVGLGRHWSERREMAEVGALQGGSGDYGILLTATYDPSDVDSDWDSDAPFMESESEVRLKPGAQVEITKVEIRAPGGGYDVVSYKPIRATANLAFYSREWRWQDWARRNGHGHLVEKTTLPALRRAVQDVLDDYGITAPLDIAMGSSGFSEGGLIDGKAHVRINPDEKNLWNALHEVAHVVCDAKGMDSFDSDHGPGFKPVYNEIFAVHGGIDLDIDRNP
jgi:hypothetical protein